MLLSNTQNVLSFHNIKSRLLSVCCLFLSTKNQLREILKGNKNHVDMTTLLTIELPMQFLSSALAVKRDIAVTIFVWCMCMRQDLPGP